MGKRGRFDNNNNNRGNISGAGGGNYTKRPKHNTDNNTNKNNNNSGNNNNNIRGHNNSTPNETKQSGGGHGGNGDNRQGNTFSALEQHLDEILYGNNKIIPKDEEDAHNRDNEALTHLRTTCIELASQLYRSEHELIEIKQTLPSLPSPMSITGLTPRTSAFPSDTLRTSASNNSASFGKTLPSSHPLPGPNFNTTGFGKNHQTNTPFATANSNNGFSATRFSNTSPFISYNAAIKMSATKDLDHFLSKISELVSKRDGSEIQNQFELEPPLTSQYLNIQKEVQSAYPKGKDWALVQKCQLAAASTVNDSAESGWTQFAQTLSMYCQYLRDMPDDMSNATQIYKGLKALTNQSILALGDTAYGVIILPTVLYLTRVLAKAAMFLDRNPDLAVNLTFDQDSAPGEATSEKVTFVESAANLLREAFIKCLADKSGSTQIGPGGRSTAENKRAGIYMTANSCLKLLFQYQKLRNAQQMFVSIDAQSPLLSQYPAAQRVTYLYYLGRYMFANSHFYRAQLALQASYDQCHVQALRHRRLILIYLISSNICLGRFPSTNLLARDEAWDLADHFIPLCKIIAKGDLVGLEKHLSSGSEYAQWFLRKRVLLQFRSKCEILVWRSLARRVFMVNGFHGGEDQKVPFLRLHHLQAAVQWLKRQQARSVLHENFGNALPPFGSFSATQTSSGSPQNENLELQYIDEDFDGAEEAARQTGFDMNTCTYGENLDGYVSEHASNGASDGDANPAIAEVESIMASMIQQGLMHGFLTHANPRFAIPGAKTRGPLAVGFPNVWKLISSQADDVVPGWVTGDSAAQSTFMGGMGGRVVNLSEARPAVAGP